MTTPGAQTASATMDGATGPSFLAGSGEMAQRMRDHDWSRTALGLPSQWPAELRTTVSMCLNASTPIQILWGPDLVHLYNDAYRPLLGNKHPALGVPASSVWPEVWETVRPMLEGVMGSGVATEAQDLPLPIARGADGGIEEGWFSFSYNPVFDERHRVIGIFCPVSETTEKVRSRRRLQDEMERLQDLFAQAPSFMAVVQGPEHRFAFANETYQRAFGPRNLIGLTVREVFPELEDQGFFELMDQVLASGEAVTRRAARVRLHRPDHALPEERFVDLVYQPIPARDGSPAGVFMQGVDITGSVHKERQETCLSAIEQQIRDARHEDDIGRTGSRAVAANLGVPLAIFRVADADDGGVLGAPGRFNVPPEVTRFGVQAQQTLQRGEPWIVADATQDARLDTAARAGCHQTRALAAVAVPLLRDGRLVGCMAAFSAEARDWRPDEVEFLASVAHRCDERIDRMRTEARLIWRDARLGALVEDSSQVLWTAQANGEMLEDSPSWRAFTGQTYEQYKGHGWASALHPDDLPAVLGAMTDAIRHSRGLDLEFRIRHADGSWRWLAEQIRPVFAGGAAVREWVGLGVEITARKEVEFRQSFLLALDDAIRPLSDPDAIAGEAVRHLCQFLDADRCTYFEVAADQNAATAVRDHAPRAVPLLGGTFFIDHYGRDFVRDMHAGAPHLVHDLRDSDLTVAERASYGAAEIGAMINIPLLKDGRLVSLVGVYQKTPRRWTEAERDFAIAVVGRCWESTERARVTDELRRADQRKDQFLATLAHELRNPLAPLQNALLIARNPNARLPPGRLFDLMDRQIQQLVRLVDDLLDISRISRGAIELQVQDLRLEQVLNTALETVRPALEAAHHTIDVRPMEASLTVRGDEVRLTQIFANLLHNAAKYTPPHGRIEVSTTLGADTVRVAVRDNGIGIPVEMQDRVFDMFTQVTQSRGQLQGGLGIGLALVKNLVELHGGSVGVHSDGPGRGSEFSITLPVAHADAPSLPVADTASDCTRMRIAVVDDNRDAADSMAELLGAMGAEIRVGYSAEEGLHLLEAFRPELAFLDIGMPGMDGYALATEVRRRTHLGPIRLVALTGWGQEGDRNRARDAGFDHHLTKPLGLEPLRRILAAHRGEPA